MKHSQEHKGRTYVICVVEVALMFQKVRFTEPSKPRFSPKMPDIVRLYMLFGTMGQQALNHRTLKTGYGSTFRAGSVAEIRAR